MRAPRTYYELRDSQVSTPPSIVSFYWDIVKQHRPKLDKVLDLGAGDARFSVGGNYEYYTGVEIDPEAANKAKTPLNGRLEINCAFKFEEDEFDACIGNPPYVRHHDIESPWKEDTARSLAEKLGFQFDMHGNLFIYFIALGLLKTSKHGLLAGNLKANHPVFHAQHKLSAGLRFFDGNQNFELPAIATGHEEIRTLRIPTPQMDIFSAIIMVLADHIIPTQDTERRFGKFLESVRKILLPVNFDPVSQYLEPKFFDSHFLDIGGWYPNTP